MPELMVEKCRLEGGPKFMPEQCRTALVPIDELKVKVRFNNGWEHFERVDEFTEKGLPIFRWTMCTKVAE
ncbi:DUF5988 family protein [Micromonospora sp. RP3T]|uniref:DUF5988 family protein n=1 Tax=Micromonospora sp. RP3T TaxID=2135446 RepID=UPI000D15D1CC|nr:DUF5988 family protein [Micromonospora sp. RP3T]PTA45206.1 hypothetical protein C8054_16505 [Micromonospora sp. RP3T]